MRSWRRQLKQDLATALNDLLFWIKTCGYHNVFWVDVRGRRRTRLHDIDDRYLLNVLRFVLRYRGRYSQLVTPVKREVRLRGYKDDGTIPAWVHQSNKAFVVAYKRRTGKRWRRDAINA